jgi:hypothetical protein
VGVLFASELAELDLVETEVKDTVADGEFGDACCLVSQRRSQLHARDEDKVDSARVIVLLFCVGGCRVRVVNGARSKFFRVIRK